MIEKRQDGVRRYIRLVLKYGDIKEIRIKHLKNKKEDIITDLNNVELKEKTFNIDNKKLRLTRIKEVINHDDQILTLVTTQ